MKESAAVRERVRLGHLDALRGLAFLFVLLVHTMATAGTIVKPWQVAFFVSGQRGVELFYIVSAFTLLFSMDMQREERHPLRNFFVRRFFRIGPLFYVAIVANLLINSRGTLSAIEIVSGFLFLHGFFPNAINSVAMGGWSVAIEANFYMLLPWLRRLLYDTRRAIYAFVLMAVPCFVLSMHLAHAHSSLSEYFSFTWFPYQFPVFLLGMLAYRLWQQWKRTSETVPARSVVDLCRVLLLVAAVLYLASLSPVPDQAGVVPLRNQHLYTASFLFVPLILAMSIAPVPLLDNVITRFLGKISYSLYLSHFFVLQLIRSYLERQRASGFGWIRLGHGLRGVAQVYCVALVLATLVSVVLYHAIEQPGIQLGRRLIAHWEKPRMPPVADRFIEREQPTSSPDAQF